MEDCLANEMYRKLKANELLEQLKRIARDYGLATMSKNSSEQDETLVVRVVCSEALL